MRVFRKPLILLIVAMLLVAGLGHPAYSVEDAAQAAIQGISEQLSAAFNAGKADAVAEAFLPNGEWIDEEGTIYQGTGEIRDILLAFFEQFPGTKLEIEIESIRQVGPVTIEEGTRTLTAASGDVSSKFRYVAVWSKNNDVWKLATFRDFTDDPVPTPNEFLQPLSWLVGEWVNEGADGKVAISYRWSDDTNFLIGEYEVTSIDGVTRKSSQRIGWDPSLGRIRSWLFEADGGFSEGVWTVLDGRILIKSSSVSPDGTLASTTMNVAIENESRFTITGTDRIVGDNLDDDFEITVVRRPPTPGK